MYKKEIIRNLKKIIKDKNILEDIKVIKNYNKDWRGFYSFKSFCVVFPESAEEIKKIVKLCNKENIKIVPQGGNTSLTGASVPSRNNYEIILNFKKINKIIKLDKMNQVIEVEAGITLDEVKKFTEKNNFYFPISIASSRSCQIGGNIATNAGGINALKYGSMIDNLRGLEVILADGSLISSMSPMKKNNTGYDLKHLFCGSEGTLGIITKALLKIYPKPKNYFHCFLAFNSIRQNVKFYKEIYNIFNEKIESAEIIPKIAIDQTVKHGFLKKSFFTKNYESLLLLKFNLFEDIEIFEKIILKKLSDMKKLYSDLIIAKSIDQEKKFWKFRCDLVESYKMEGKYITNDISVPLDKLENFIKETSKKINTLVPKTRIYSFGHLGDGNIHFNMIEPINFKSNFNDYRDEIYKIVNDSVYKFGGSFSAEHGIGIIKKKSLKKYKSKNDIKIMKKIKYAFDPNNILNPGKIFDL